MNLITQAKFAKLVDIGKSGVSYLMKNRLMEAVHGKKIDLDHPETIKYLDEKNHKKKRNSHKKKDHPEPLGNPTDYFLNLTVRDVLGEYGTVENFIDHLIAIRDKANVEYKFLRSAQKKGDLIPRSEALPILDFLNTANVKLMTDGAKTITKRATTMVEAGRSFDDIEAFVIDVMRQHIDVAHDKVERKLNSLILIDSDCG